MRRLLLASLCVLFASVLTFAADSGPLLLQSPTLSKTQIAFAFGGDIWIVNRAGGDAQRLVTGTGLLSDPTFRRTARWSPTPAITTAISTSTWSRPLVVSPGD